MIWIIHRQYYKTIALKPVTASTANGNKEVSPLPNSTTLQTSLASKLESGVYYIDERDIIPAAASDITYYEQVDSPKAIQSTTSVGANQGYLSILSSDELESRMQQQHEIGSRTQQQHGGVSRHGNALLPAEGSNGYLIVHDEHKAGPRVRRNNQYQEVVCSTAISSPPVENVYEDVQNVI